MQAFHLYKHNQQYKEVASLVGVHFETIGKWVRTYRAQGREGIVSKKHGHKSGSERALNTEQAQNPQNRRRRVTLRYPLSRFAIKVSVPPKFELLV